jgi:hypothetical protein
MSTLKNNFTMFLHIMVEYNQGNRIEKKLIYFYVYHGGLEYINIKEYNCVLKNTNILPKKNLYEICTIYFTCDSTYFEPCEKFSKKIFFFKKIIK